MWGYLARCGWNYTDQDWDFLDGLFFLGLALGLAINPIKTVKYFFTLACHLHWENPHVPLSSGLMLVEKTIPEH
jgi:hypothetical protein